MVVKISYSIALCTFIALSLVAHASAGAPNSTVLIVDSAGANSRCIVGCDGQIEVILSHKSAKDWSQFTEKNVRSQVSVQFDGDEVWCGRLDTPIRGGSLMIPQVVGNKTLLDPLNSGEASLTVETVPTCDR